jgi:hypothetical protein
MTHETTFAPSKAQLRDYTKEELLNYILDEKQAMKKEMVEVNKMKNELNRQMVIVYAKKRELESKIKKSKYQKNNPMDEEIYNLKMQNMSLPEIGKKFDISTHDARKGFNRFRAKVIKRQKEKKE